jgi:hypothetical protein
MAAFGAARVQLEFAAHEFCKPGRLKISLATTL